MIETNNFNMSLFYSLYNDFSELMAEIDENSHDIEGHEWIDLDEIVSNNCPTKYDAKSKQEKDGKK
jgi:hypothetical protein